jgi:hypothetical protein
VYEKKNVLLRSRLGDPWTQLFIKKLVPSYVAVVLSVVLVLAFGEVRSRDRRHGAEGSM